MKIVIFEVEEWEQAAFDALAGEHKLVFTAERLSGENADRYRSAEIVSPFIHSRLDADVLGRMMRLRMIATRSTGYDHISLETCLGRGIAVCNVPVYGEHTVAEHVFGLLLTISHRLVEAIDRTRRGQFDLHGLRGFDLRGKMLGVVGTGAIGEHVIAIARGFGMQVTAHDPVPRPQLADRHGFRYVPLDELLAASDIVTLHVPATPRTHHLIGAAELARMKKGSVLINTARGSLVDTHALLRALSDGTLRAAGLDVLPEEPAIREEAELLRRTFQDRHNLADLLADHILLRHRNVVITPHSAFNTTEAVQRILDTTADNIRAFIAGTPQNTIHSGT